MTLNDFFAMLNEHPAFTMGFLILIPALAFIIGVIADDRSNLNPWKQIYMVLLYLICIPGIFSVSLLLFTFLFENKSIYDIDLITHFLPLVSMIVTIIITRRYVSLDEVPGFGKLTGLIMMISVILLILWVLQKTRIIMFTYMPIIYVLLILLALILVFRFGMKRLLE